MWPTGHIVAWHLCEKHLELIHTLYKTRKKVELFTTVTSTQIFHTHCECPQCLWTDKSFSHFYLVYYMFACEIIQYKQVLMLKKQIRCWVSNSQLSYDYSSLLDFPFSEMNHIFLQNLITILLFQGIILALTARILIS
jgi:hypothetical protein